MVYLVHGSIMDEDLIRMVLIQNKTPLDEAARLLDVPYNSLRLQAKKRLKTAEWKSVLSNRKRKTYSMEFKKQILKEAEAEIKELHDREKKRYKDEAREKSLIRIEVYKEFAAKYKVKTSLLNSWRRFFLERLKTKGKKNAPKVKKSSD